MPRTSITGTKTYKKFIGLGLGLWEPFQPTEVIDLRIFTYESKTSRIMKERVKNVTVMEGDPIAVVN